ncbi:hypothetical protein ABIA43_006629 [Bradyrhizobium sp. USDA 328]
MAQSWESQKGVAKLAVQRMDKFWGRCGALGEELRAPPMIWFHKYCKALMGYQAP